MDIEKTNEQLLLILGPPTQINYVDGDTVISLPDTLGGGTIIEPEYELSPNQLLIFRGLTLWPQSETINLNPETYSTDRRPETIQEHIDGTRTAKLWQEKDALRIVQPLADFISSKRELGHDVNEFEQEFLGRFEAQKDENTKAITLWEDSEEQQSEQDAIKHITGNLAELERRKQGRLLYQDGTDTDTYTERNLAHRRHLVLNGAIFTDGYRSSKIGQLTMRFLHGISPGDIDTEWQGVAALDARLSAVGILNDEEIHALNKASRGVLSPSSYWAALEARQMYSTATHPRLTAGDGKQALSRPGPGQ